MSLSAPADFSSVLMQKVAAIVSAGVDWVQLREKHLPARDLSNLAREASRTAAAYPDGERSRALVLVNDRLDVALAAHADGVHLGENGLPVNEVKALVEESARAHPGPKNFLVGVSCHTLEGAKSAASGGAHYIFFGPVFATPSKSAFGEPQGIGRLAEICRAAPIPVLAIGGITLENAAACISAGAGGIAGIRLFQDAADPAATIEELRQLIA